MSFSIASEESTVTSATYTTSDEESLLSYRPRTKRAPRSARAAKQWWAAEKWSDAFCVGVEERFACGDEDWKEETLHEEDEEEKDQEDQEDDAPDEILEAKASQEESTVASVMTATKKIEKAIKSYSFFAKYHDAKTKQEPVNEEKKEKEILNQFIQGNHRGWGPVRSNSTNTRSTNQNHEIVKETMILSDTSTFEDTFDGSQLRELSINETETYDDTVGTDDSRTYDSRTYDGTYDSRTYDSRIYDDGTYANSSDDSRTYDSRSFDSASENPEDDSVQEEVVVHQPKAKKSTTLPKPVVHQPKAKKSTAAVRPNKASPVAAAPVAPVASAAAAAAPSLKIVACDESYASSRDNDRSGRSGRTADESYASSRDRSGRSGRTAERSIGSGTTRSSDSGKDSRNDSKNHSKRTPDDVHNLEREAIPAKRVQSFASQPSDCRSFGSGKSYGSTVSKSAFVVTPQKMLSTYQSPKITVTTSDAATTTTATTTKASPKTNMYTKTKSNTKKNPKSSAVSITNQCRNNAKKKELIAIGRARAKSRAVSRLVKEEAAKPKTKAFPYLVNHTLFHQNLEKKKARAVGRRTAEF